MRKQKTILESHEVFCEELKKEVKNYDLEFLYAFVGKYKNIFRYADYVSIFEDEILLKESKK